MALVFYAAAIAAGAAQFVVQVAAVSFAAEREGAVEGFQGFAKVAAVLAVVSEFEFGDYWVYSASCQSLPLIPMTADADAAPSSEPTVAGELSRAGAVVVALRAGAVAAPQMG